MYSRVVCLLLLPTVLLTQWASFFRCHGECWAAGHDSRPHVHLNALIPGQPAKGCGCRHRQSHSIPQGQAGFSGQPVGENTVASLPPSSSHDEVVLYVSLDLCLGFRSHVGSDFRVGADLLFISHDTPIGVYDRGHAVSCRTHLPPIPFPSCPIYLSTLSLLV